MGRINYRYIPVHIINLNCTGHEETVWGCSSNTQEKQRCSVYDTASVACHSKS